LTASVDVSDANTGVLTVTPPVITIDGVVDTSLCSVVNYAVYDVKTGVNPSTAASFTCT